MSLRSQIGMFTDGNGFVTPQVANPAWKRGSDNGTMFTSEYYTLLAKRNELMPGDRGTWAQKIISSELQLGLTVRAPGDTSLPDAPDNLYGIMAAAKVLQAPLIADCILQYGIKHCGFYGPGLKSFQWRQPQLLMAMLCASDRYNSWFHWPLAVITALIIVTSCIMTDTGNTDARRLCWLLIQAVQQDSWLCRVASNIWRRRLLKDYPNGMLDVARIYYGTGHPFRTYFVRF